MLRLSGRSANRLTNRFYSTANRNDVIMKHLEKQDVQAASKSFLELYKPSLSWQISSSTYNNLFRQVKQAKNEDVIQPKELFNKLLDGRHAQGWMAKTVIMDDVLSGHAEKGLESWVKFLETLGSAEKAQSMVNSEAAWSALIAYIVNCQQENVPLDTKVALRLVPLKKLPSDSQILSVFGVRSLPKETVQAIVSGVQQIRLDALDPNGVAFLSSLSSNGRKELSDKWDEAKAKSEQTGVPLTEASYAQFMRCFTEATAVGKAFEIFNEMQQILQPTTIGMNALLMAGAHSRKDADLLVERILEEINAAEIPMTADTYATLMEFYFRTHKPAQALGLFNDISNNKIEGVSVSLKIFAIVLNGLLKTGNIEEAEILLRDGQAKGYAVNVYTYNAFLSAYVTTKQYEKLGPMLKEMKANQVEPSVVTYTTMIDATFKTSRENNTAPNETIDALLNEMSERRLKANTTTVTSIIGGLIKASNDIQGARLVFDKLLVKRLSPNARTFATIIDGEVKIGDIDRALKYFYSMPRHNLAKSTPIYNQLLRGLAQQRRVTDAFKLFNELVADRTTDPNKFSYYFMLQGCMREADLGMAQQVVDKLAAHYQSYQFDLGDKLPHMLKKLTEQSVNVPSEFLTQ